VRRLALALILLVVLAGAVCAQKVQVGRLLADPWVPITALPTYRGFWDKNVACLAQIPKLELLEAVQVPSHWAPFDSLHFYVAGTTTFINPGGRIVYGQFFPPDTIVLAGKLLQDERLVRHEMLHAQGWDYHPLVPFRFPCNVE
jgi:hypothetical protein